MVFMWVVPLAVLGVLVWLVIEGGRRRETQPAPTPPTIAVPAAVPAPRTVLDERYARGEIERDDYLQRRQDLGG